MKRKKWVLLFDVDGTLVRTAGAGVASFAEGLREVFGWEDALAGISMAGMTDAAIAQQVARGRLGRELTAHELERFFARYLERLAARLPDHPGFRVLPGIREFLAHAAAQAAWALGLGTGNLAEGARLKLERAGIWEFFRFGGYGSDSADRPELLRVAVRRAADMRGSAVDPDEVVVIGDTPKDVAAGRAIGARTVAVATGPYTLDDLSAAGADLVLGDFSESGLLQEFLRKV